MADSISTAKLLTSGKASRRDFLYVATAAFGAVGAVASLIPMISQMNPDASTLAAGGPVDLDLSKVAPGQQVVLRWRTRPVFVTHRIRRRESELADMLKKEAQVLARAMAQAPKNGRAVKPGL